LGTGFLGSFTTFSTFSVEVSGLIHQEAYFFAASYVIASVAGGFLSAGLGFYFSSLLLQRRELNDNGN
ncbi:MAG: CrcB family protein, partial [Bacillota bacterium]